MEHLPPATELVCKKCEKQMVFLMQVSSISINWSHTFTFFCRFMHPSQELLKHSTELCLYSAVKMEHAKGIDD